MTSDDAARGSRWPGMWEVAIALLLIVLAVRVLAGAGGGEGFHRADLLGYLLTAAAASAVALARRQPLVALVAASLLTTSLAWLDYHVDVLQFVVTGLLFMVASYCTRGIAVIGLAVATALLYVSAASGPEDLGPDVVLQSLGIFTAAWALGRLTRSRRTALLALVSEAEQRATAEKELAAAERDRITLTQVEERLRIARDVHDVLAHSISVVSVQATVGAHLAADDPDAARRALLTISDVSRSSMGELRQMLALLRDDSAAGSEDAVSYEPARGLKDVELLVETYRSAGLPVESSTKGTPRELSASADLCAYRIIQEALTNTLKHAGPSTASVGITYDVDALQVVVSDDGRGAAITTGGHGLVGMRERTSLLGGRLEVGPAAAAGFTVTATIPYESQDLERV
jgi:signal transduction histidine kinase